MGTHQNVIELNGKAYDVSTGRPLDSQPQTSLQPAHHPKPRHPGVVDGFFKQPRRKPLDAASAQPKPHTPSHTPTPVAHTTHHKPQKATTLMRHSVSKPALAPQESASDTIPKLGKPHAARLERAKAVNKSSAISKFSFGGHSSINKELKPLAVQKAPHHMPKPTHHLSPPVVAAPKPVQEQSVTTPAQVHFDRALAQATAHEEQTPKTHRRHQRRISRALGISEKSLTMSTVALAAILLIGFFTYQNIPNISMRIAAQRAGFSAKLPEYRPTGFAMSGPIKYGPGQIVVNFKSNADDRSFDVSQKLSNWNSEALVDNYLSAGNKTYQTFEDKGRTIYTYDGANATWVSGGVWYQIEGNSSLTNDQLLKIATSM